MKYHFLTSNKDKFVEANNLFVEHSLKLNRITKSYDEIQADNLMDVVISAIKGIVKPGVFIEDSGLFINALAGFPGVYSSYVYKTLGNVGILKLLNNIDDRSAIFESVIAYKGKKEVKIFKGSVKGNISRKIKGSNGFGYDPIFIPLGYDETFAENYAVKRGMSHRNASITRLIGYLKEDL
jgi:XTP/dITP diphosphohydrolase|tara:strand:- start:331 stop:873 length:543 start_codon:yes stop_codon:yes gene_type:complete